MSTLKLYLGVLISFSCNNIAVIGYLDKLITFIVDLGLKFIQTKSMLLQPYIIGRLIFNDKEATMSTSNLRMKFPLENGKIAIVHVSSSSVDGKFRKVHQIVSSNKLVS